MLIGLLLLVGCQLAGEVVVRSLDLGIPGPILGMVLLLVVLRLRPAAAEQGRDGAGQLLLRHLQVLYVPAGVGIVLHLHRLGADALPITAGLLLSWVAGLLVAGAAAQFLVRRLGADT